MEWKDLRNCVIWDLLDIFQMIFGAVNCLLSPACVVQELRFTSFISLLTKKQTHIKTVIQPSEGPVLIPDSFQMIPSLYSEL